MAKRCLGKYHLWKGKTQRTDSSCENRWIRHSSGHKTTKKQEVMIPKTVQNCFRILKHAPGPGKVGHRRLASCGGSGGTPLKAVLYRVKWPPTPSWVGGMVIKAFSQAILRAQHFSKHLLGCLEMEAKPFQPSWPSMPRAAPGSHQWYASLVPRKGLLTSVPCTDVRRLCVYFYGQAPELSLDSQFKKVSNHYPRKF